LRIRVTSHTEDDGMSIVIELGGRGLARTVTSTSSQRIWVIRLGSSISRGNEVLAIRTTIGAGGGGKRRCGR